MNECILCLNKILKKNSIKIDTNDECELTIEGIIKLHFWFFDKILTDSSDSIVCKTCWNKLESFHEFFSAVKFNYKVEENEQQEKTFSENIIFVKNETIDTSDLAIIVKQDEESTENSFRTFSNDESIEPDEPKPRRGRKRKAGTESKENSSKKARYDVTDEELGVLRVHTDFKCEKCSQNLNNWKEIRAHYRQEHKICGYVRCCGRKIDRSNEVKDHANWHLNPHIFQCHICGKSAISREHLRLHEETHIPTEDRQFSCEKCDKKFVNKYNLNMHEKVHEKDGKKPSIPCNICDKLYKTERQLKMHIDFCHKNAEQSWICHICSKVLKSKYTLDIHVKAHTNPDDPIECTLCGHILKNKRRFAIHMAKHKSAECGPHECEKGCGKIFKHRPAMLDHVAFVHTKNRFNCSHCGKEFKHKKALDEHEVTQHGGLDPYSCPFCDRTFKNSANMHSHKKRAHPEEYKTLPAPSYLRGSIGDYCE